MLVFVDPAHLAPFGKEPVLSTMRPQGFKPDEQDYKMTRNIGFLFVTLFLMVIACLCWLLCPICSRCLMGQNSPPSSASFSDLLQTYPNKRHPQDKFSHPPPVYQIDGEERHIENQVELPLARGPTNVEEIQSHERRTLDSVFEPDPNTAATNCVIPDTIVQCNHRAFNVSSATQIHLPVLDPISPASRNEQFPQEFIPGPLHSVTTHNSLPLLPVIGKNSLLLLPDNRNNGLPLLPENRNNSLPLLPDNFNKSLPLLPDNRNNSLPFFPENINEISGFPLHYNHTLSRLPTIPEHPITSDTTRTLSNEIIANPSSLPDFTAPSTSSMPDLAPSTSFPAYFPPRNISRLVFYRNTNIDVRDIQNSNPEFEVPNGDLSSIGSNDSLASVDPPERKIVVVDFHNHDSPAKN